MNHKRVARLMREHGIQGAHRRRRRSLTRPDKKARPAPDLIGRDFHADIPGTKLVPGNSGLFTSPRTPSARLLIQVRAASTSSAVPISPTRSRVGWRPDAVQERGP